MTLCQNRATEWSPWRTAALLCAGVSCLVHCGGSSGQGNQQTQPDAAAQDGALSGDATVDPDAEIAPPAALLEVHALDIWAQPLPEAEGTLGITSGGAQVSHVGWPLAVAGLHTAGTYTVTLSAPEHETAMVTMSWTGGDGLAEASFVLDPTVPDQGLSVSREHRTVQGNLIPVFTVHVGLRHRWFSAQGRPARRGNQVDLLMDGEEAWGAVYDGILASQQSVHLATWWWNSEFELIRPEATHHLLTEAERWENTALGVLESLPVMRRLLVGEFWGSNSLLDFMTTDPELAAYADTAGDDFEVMGQGNPTYGVYWFEPSPVFFGERLRDAHPEVRDRTFDAEEEIPSRIPAREVDLTAWPVSVEVQIASYHQKFAVVDDAVAFIGGMNAKGVDWDTSAHRVYEHRRMDFGDSQTQRQEVMTKDSEPTFGPRKDYIVRIEGPAVQDAAEVFQQRWAYQIDQGADYSQHCTDFLVDRSQPEAPGGIQVQVTATLPEPFHEQAIGETWFNAVANADRYIFVEDQYWRIPMLVDVIMDRMAEVPGLRLLVVTKPVSEWLDPGCEWTHATHQQLMAAFPSRYRTYQLRAFDTVVTWGWDETESRFKDMDLHSKLLIVDDQFLSVGSANKNNRGIVYEGELNLAVLDPAWVTEARRRIFSNMLPPGTPATNDVSVWWQQFQDAAYWNDNVWSNWEAEGWDIDLGDGSIPLPTEYTPSGFVYSLGFRTVNDCFIEGVGPDMT
jgi:hypothetical protein